MGNVFNSSAAQISLTMIPYIPIIGPVFFNLVVALLIIMVVIIGIWTWRASDDLSYIIDVIEEEGVEAIKYEPIHEPIKDYEEDDTSYEISKPRLDSHDAVRSRRRIEATMDAYRRQYEAGLMSENTYNEMKAKAEKELMELMLKR